MKPSRWLDANLIVTLSTTIVAIWFGVKLYREADWIFLAKSVKVVWENLPLMLIGAPGLHKPLFGLGGLILSLSLAAISIMISFVIGLVFGTARLSQRFYLRYPAILYIEVIRGTPLIMVIFWFYFFIPIFTGRDIGIFWSSAVAFSIFSGAYLAEIVRAGIQAVPFGHREAAFSTGLTYFQTMRYIILPQALKIMIPPMVGQFISLFKDTSLAFVIGLRELMSIATNVNNREIYYPFAIYITVACLYFLCSFSMSRVARKLEERLTPEGAIDIGI
ncbi:MAG: amino acid ABC transporter permease [Candidatus Tectomicrobia bacterium]|nr:amino acid ABC transporter permease [Candidatus Tectomicrobia bacterium]